jgi:hypothetical protein
MEGTAAGPTTRSALLLDTVWTITSHTATSTAAAVRDIELDPRGEGLIMVTTVTVTVNMTVDMTMSRTTIMVIRATMAAPVRRSTMMRAHRSSILIVRHRRHVQHLRSQPARAAVVVGALAVAGIRAEVSAAIGPFGWR